MRNFFRVLKQSWAYRYRLLMSFGAAIIVAVLWSASLSAIYPVLTLLSETENLQTWVDREIERYETEATEPKRLERIEEHRRMLPWLNSHPEEKFRDQELRNRTKDLARLERELGYYNTRVYRYQLLKKYVISQLPTKRFDTFVYIIVGLLIVVAIKGFFEFWQDTLVGSAVSRTLFDLRNRVFRQLIHHDPRQIQEVGTPDMMARVTNDLEQVGGGMKILYGKMLLEPLKAFFCIVLACLVSWQLTVTFLLLIAPTFIALGRFSRVMKKAARKVLERMSNIYKVLRETFDGIKVVKAFTMETAERQRFRDVTNDYYRRSMRVIRIDAFAGPLIELLGVTAVSIALLAGAYLVMEGKTHIFGLRMTHEKLEFESLIQLYALLAAIADPVRRMSSVFSKIQNGAAAADRVYALADKEPKITLNADGQDVPQHRESIEFRNVCFSYVPGQEPGTLNHVDLHVQAGETIAIVGPNGCGKSTLLGLLARFHDPDYGSVLVDGVNLRTANLRTLRKQIGLVTQDTVLFNDTIEKNIAYGKRRASREEVISAAKRAFAHEFILAKPHGYDEHVGDQGSQLSGGQKQRIALARAILRDPSILILDEFTSQIDVESEFQIHEAMRAFAKDRTTFLVTHRLGALELADRVVVMYAGQIIAEGTHSYLMKTNALYQRLHEGQSLRVA